MHSRRDEINRGLSAVIGGASVPASRSGVRERLVSAARLLGAVATGLIARTMAIKRRGAKTRRLELIETLALGGRRQLFIVMCDNERYLVGAGAESVGTIVPLETRSKPPEKASRGPLLVRERHRDAGRIMSADPIRRKVFEAASETGDLWQ